MGIVAPQEFIPCRLAHPFNTDKQERRHGGGEKLLAESSYDGTPIVLTVPGNIIALKAQPIVAAQLLREAPLRPG